MKKQKGKSQAQKARYTANSIKVVPLGQNFKTSTSKSQIHGGCVLILKKLIINTNVWIIYIVVTTMSVYGFI